MLERLAKDARVSSDEWIKIAKQSEDAQENGMYLFHNGVVRATAKAKVRENKDVPNVEGLNLGVNWAEAERAVEETKNMDGISYVRVMLNEGELVVGDDIMWVLIGGDIRPRVIAALEYLVDRLKNDCLLEQEF